MEDRGPAGELTSLSSGPVGYPSVAVNETCSYNGLLQVTHITSTRLQNNVPAGTLMDMQYVYNDGQNNGRIKEANDLVNGEDVTYAYDSLQRLIAASTTNPGGFENGMSGWTVDAGTWATDASAAHSGTAGAIAG